MDRRSCSVLCFSLHLFINILLLILGMSLLGLGLAEESPQLALLLTSDSKIGGAAVVIGVILVVVTTINCCFAIDGSSLFYYFYAGILLLVFSVMVGLVVAYGSEIGTKVRRDVRSSMRELMHYDPDGSGKTYMDSIQQTFQCCGVDSYKDWKNVTENPSIPASCCVQVGCDTSDIQQINQKDCVTSVMNTVDTQLLRMSAIGISIMVFLPIQALLVLLITRFSDTDPV